MNRESIFDCTANYRDYLLKDLVDPEFAKHYLEISLVNYQKDGNIEIFAHAVRNVVEAHYENGELAMQVNGNLQDLYANLDSRNSPQLDFLLEILSALGFRTGFYFERATLDAQIDLYTDAMLFVEQ